jgi:hypothetical protein
MGGPRYPARLPLYDPGAFWSFILLIPILQMGIPAGSIPVWYSPNFGNNIVD